MFLINTNERVQEIFIRTFFTQLIKYSDILELTNGN